MVSDNHLQTLLQLDSSLPEFPDRLCGVLDAKDFGDYIADLESDDSLKLVEFLDEVRSHYGLERSLTKFISGPQ